ncbi:MAG: hypothetical protein AUH85_18590 [Chloroflexi bacterium 13_1_40CM_4_68_4]|nr:MAG: hypothetical protein AUH85_18590 [Chloroflexi bacterium 13_1_40CM_4_68_4]
MPVPLVPIAELNRLDLADFAGAMARVFEPNPLLLEGLARGRPYRSYADLLAAARARVGAMSEPELVGLLASHPRIGAPDTTLSVASRREQRAPAVTDAGVEAELARLQDEYERRNGFRFVVFVNDRARAAILEVLRERAGEQRDVELARSIEEYLAICASRLGVRG